jgi:hypothetical protein
MAAVPQTHIIFFELTAAVNEIPVDLECPENNGGLLLFVIDHKIGGTLHKCVLICKERVHAADFQSGKYKAQLVSPNIIEILEPTIQAPFLDSGGGQQTNLLNLLVRRQVIDDQGEQDLKIQLNAITQKTERREKYTRLIFPKNVQLSNHLFSAGSDDKIKSKSITFSFDVELAPGTTRAIKHASLEMFVFWKVVMVEERQRVIDGASTNEELDDILDSFSGTTLN